MKQDCQVICFELEERFKKGMNSEYQTLTANNAQPGKKEHFTLQYVSNLLIF